MTPKATRCANNAKPGARPNRVCLACTNQHGCLTPQALCLDLLREPEEADLRGQAFMARRGLLANCRGCAHFRRCWDEDLYSIARRESD
jgi:hypothetical protein